MKIHFASGRDVILALCIAMQSHLHQSVAPSWSTYLRATDPRITIALLAKGSAIFPGGHLDLSAKYPS